MHTASYEFLMKPKESAGCHQTLSTQVRSGDETRPSADCFPVVLRLYNIQVRPYYFCSRITTAVLSCTLRAWVPHTTNLLHQVEWTQTLVQ